MNYRRSMSAMRFAVMLATLASCGVSNEDQRDDPEQSDVVDTPELAVPPELQLITPVVTCSSKGGVCTGAALCTGSGGHTVTATCPSGKVCCVTPPPPTCASSGGVCTSSALCTGSGGHSISEPCSVGKICCVH